MTTNTNTKTFGKEAKNLVRKIFPTVAKHKVHGKNKMNQFINFYDKDDNLLGFWTNEGKETGTFRKF
jgi:hypothetical protein